MKKIPYAISSYETIRQKNLYYVDKTSYIPLLEERGYYLIFIRPRRFGKSSLLTMLESYYDLAYADEFDALFCDTYIYDHPTPEKQRYLILKFNFSQINATSHNVTDSFAEYLATELFLFGDKYHHILGERCLRRLETINDPYQQLVFLTRFVGTIGHKIYVLIDEYDNFANTILVKQGQEAYHQLTHGDGILRHFFSILKGATDQRKSGIARLFITGVSPVTLDDVTSGFNIGTNISLDPTFNELLGFTQNDLNTLLVYYHEHGVMSEESLATIIPLMQMWYGHYRFAAEAVEPLFNTTLVLYFMRSLLLGGNYPDDLIDENMGIDYTKLRHLVVLDQRLNGNFGQLTNILNDEQTFPMHVAKSFPVEHLTQVTNFLSLLFYFGLLSYTDHQTLQIPNETVKKIMYGYIRDGYADVNVFSVNLVHFAELVRQMAYAGEWKPVFAFLAAEVEKQTAIRDYLHGEKVVQTFLLAYLNVVDYYLTRSEQEMNKGFADIVLEPFWDKYADIRYCYIIEVKYLSIHDYTVEREQAEVAEGKAQIEQYAMDEAFIKRNRGATMQGIVLVFRGWELMVMEEVGGAETYHPYALS